MPATTPNVGEGLTFAHGSLITASTLNLLSVSGSGGDREVFDASHLGTTGGRPFLASKSYDPGQIEIEFQHDADFDWAAVAALTTAQAITITWPDAETTVYAATYLLGPPTFTASRGVMTGTARFKLSGSYPAF